MTKTTNTHATVTKFLEALPAWDGVSRLKTWLPDYLNVQVESDEHALYVQEAGCRWMISAVARAMQPGCKSKGVLVLEGKQGSRKSTALSVLAGPELYGDDLPDLQSNDAIKYISEKWIVDLADAVTSSDIEVAKGFISRREELSRAAYSGEVTQQPRHCVFALTTHNSDQLHGGTASRHFWTVRVGMCDIEKLMADRDQLWSEALASYKSGECWDLANDALRFQGSIAAPQKIKPLRSLTSMPHETREITISRMLPTVGAVALTAEGEACFVSNKAVEIFCMQPADVFSAHVVPNNRPGTLPWFASYVSPVESSEMPQICDAILAYLDDVTSVEAEELAHSLNDSLDPPCTQGQARAAAEKLFAENKLRKIIVVEYGVGRQLLFTAIEADDVEVVDADAAA